MQNPPMQKRRQKGGVYNYDPLPVVFEKLHCSVYETRMVGLYETSKFLCEVMQHAIIPPTIPVQRPRAPYVPSHGYILAQNYFDCGQYEQCVHQLDQVVERNDHVTFLYYYSRYMVEIHKLRRRVFEEPDYEIPLTTKEMNEKVYFPLRKKFRKFYIVGPNLQREVLNLDPKRLRGEPSPFLYYLFGVMLKRNKKYSKAALALIRSVVMNPTLWCSWSELCEIVSLESYHRPIINEEMKKLVKKRAGQYLPMLLFDDAEERVRLVEMSKKKVEEIRRKRMMKKQKHKKLQDEEENEEEEEGDEDEEEEEEGEVEIIIDNDLVMERVNNPTDEDIKRVYDVLFGEQTDDFPIYLLHLDQMILKKFFRPGICSPIHFFMYCFFMQRASFLTGGSQGKIFHKIGELPKHGKEKDFEESSIQENFVKISNIIDVYFREFPQSVILRAKYLYSIGELEEAKIELERMRENYPFMLDGMDTLAHIYFCQEDSANLSGLAHKIFEVKKFSKESCIAVGNYYSLLKRHEHAIFYYQRATQVCPTSVSAWVLCGHAYVSMGNTTAAVHSYRHGIRCCPADWRPWHGLGRVYQRTGASQYSIYYLSKAVSCKKYDPHLWFSLAEAYIDLERFQDAVDCLKTVSKFNTLERLDALIRLGRLYWTKKGDFDSAAYNYQLFVSFFEKESGIFKTKIISEEDIKRIERRNTNRFLVFQEEVEDDESEERRKSMENNNNVNKDKDKDKETKEKRDNVGDYLKSVREAFMRRKLGRRSSPILHELQANVRRDGPMEEEEEEDNDNDKDNDDEGNRKMKDESKDNEDNEDNLKKRFAKEFDEENEDFLYYFADEHPTEKNFMIKKQKSKMSQFVEALIFLFRYFNQVKFDKLEFEKYESKLGSLKEAHWMGDILVDEINRALKSKRITIRLNE